MVEILLSSLENANDIKAVVAFQALSGPISFEHFETISSLVQGHIPGASDKTIASIGVITDLAASKDPADLDNTHISSKDIATIFELGQFVRNMYRNKTPCGCDRMMELSASSEVSDPVRHMIQMVLINLLSRDAQFFQHADDVNQLAASIQTMDDQALQSAQILAKNIMNKFSN